MITDGIYHKRCTTLLQTVQQTHTHTHIYTHTYIYILTYLLTHQNVMMVRIGTAAFSSAGDVMYDLLIR